MGVPGTVYLLHLSKAFKHARHYLGWTHGVLEARLELHKSGGGAKMLAAAAREGITFQVVRTWPGDRGRERTMKRQGGRTRFCPICGGTKQGRVRAEIKQKRGTHGQFVVEAKS